MVFAISLLLIKTTFITSIIQSVRAEVASSSGYSSAVAKGNNNVIVNHRISHQVRHNNDDNNHNNNNHNQFSEGFDGFIRIPNDATIPFNQEATISKNGIAGSGIPKNLIVGASCQVSCPPIIGTQRDDIIYAAAVTDALVYALGGDDIALLGSGNPKVYGGSGDDLLVGGSGNSQIYGGQNDDVLIGGFGNNLLVGGPGNDQLYAGPGHDILIGGQGADFFDCGPNGNSVISDFNPSQGDIKAGNCKFVVALSEPSQ
jgi:Ca2+-binding RTX toxin-like protein